MDSIRRFNSGRDNLPLPYPHGGLMPDVKKLIAGTAAYTVCTFLLAVIWHVLLFKERYE